MTYIVLPYLLCSFSDSYGGWCTQVCLWRKRRRYVRLGISKLSIESINKLYVSLFFLLFFLEVAWVENCLSYAEGPGIERAIFFCFSASQLWLSSHFCLVLQQHKLGCFPFYCPRPCAGLTPMSTWQTASRMGHLAECRLRGCVGVLRNKFVSSFFLIVYRIPLTEMEEFVSVIRSLLF